jgi:hypothetical protein
MDAHLAEVLVERNVVKPDMEVTAAYFGVGLSGAQRVPVQGDFFVREITRIDGRLVFSLQSTRDGTRKKVYCEAISRIEGMDPIRYAQIYNIKADGSSGREKKKRGRKTKAEKEAMLNGQNN